MVNAKHGNISANKRLFSIKELVNEIGCTEWFWRTQIWAGRLPFVKVGRKMMIDTRDVDDFIQRYKDSH